MYICLIAMYKVCLSLRIEEYYWLLTLIEISPLARNSMWFVDNYNNYYKFADIILIGPHL